MFWREFHPWICPIAKKKPKLGSMIFIIFLQTFMVSLLLISAAACKKVISGPKIWSNWVKNSQKKCFWNAAPSKLTSGISHSVQQISMNFARLVHVYFGCLTAKFQPIDVGSAEIWIFFVFKSSKNFTPKKVHFSKFALCSTDFDGLCRISTRILQISHSQISAELL